jgi:hypothetical protein
MSNALMANTLLALSQADDVKKALIDKTKDVVASYKLFDDDVLLGTYIEPEKTAGGILKTQRMLDESRFQGKVGLLLKIGPSAFKYDRSGVFQFEGDKPALHTWCVYRASDGWEISLNGVSCRIIRANALRGHGVNPKDIW